MVTFTAEMINEYFASQGLLEGFVADYYYRHEQAELSQAIARSFLEDKFLVAEVGTGVGKTLAYLVPSVLWAKTQGEKVVITTKTRALQQQIIEKDIPDLVRALKLNVLYAEAKGRDNFLCWNKYIDILAGKRSLLQEEQEFMQAILKWAEKTKSGDKKEINLKSSLLNSHWHLLASDRRTCLRDKCEYHDKCFRLKMIRNLEKADLIVTNHAMLLSDIQVDNSLLPEYKYLVVDEAHALDRESFDKLSLNCKLEEISDVLRVLNFNDKGFKRGYLRQIKRRNQELDIEESLSLCDKIADMAAGFFRQLSQGLKSSESQYALVLSDDVSEEKWFANAFDIYFDLQHLLHQLLSNLRKINHQLGEEEEPELINIINVLEEISDTLYFIMEENIGAEEKIVWIQTDRDRATGIASSYVRIGEVLENKLYSKLKSLVMLSATLSIEDSFDYFIEKNGLMNYLKTKRLNFLLEKSPFDYEKQACLYILQDLPDPQNKDFTHEIALVLKELLIAVPGRTMVLFTARKSLSEVSSFIRPFCEQNGISLLVQNEDGGFGSLMDEYAREENAVLMGLDTFWEGVDLKGDLLTLLVVVKLPFRSLAEPYSSAGDKFFRLQNRSSFMNFLLPDAAVRFKQGVGRLIRSETDRGTVVVLENRMAAKAYGRVYQNRIPIKNIVKTEKAEIVNLIKNWLEEKHKKRI